MGNWIRHTIIIDNYDYIKQSRTDFKDIIDFITECESDLFIRCPLNNSYAILNGALIITVDHKNGCYEVSTKLCDKIYNKFSCDIDLLISYEEDPKELRCYLGIDLKKNVESFYE